MTRRRMVVTIVAAMALVAGGEWARAQSANDADEQRVGKFLEKMRGQWRDMNVPEADGKILHDLIVKNQFKRALEIGTSTGHSGVWMASALRKTGGKLTTLEIDERRYREAVANFKEAGVEKYIDARLGDAHVLAEQLAGPWDFVFIDADKDWYTNYAKAVIPKMAPGGCIVGHNVSRPRSDGGRSGMSGTAEYYQYMLARSDFESYIHAEGRNGVAVSCRKK